MERPNPFYRRSRISAEKFRQLLRLFALDLTATDAAQLTGLTRKSVTTIFLKIRERIAEECERDWPLSSGEVEVDESYFGARRVRGKRGRGASGKTIVFGLLKREGRVYTEIVADCKKVTLQAIIRGRAAPELC
jgi:transposase